jgi:hypothetical protein
VQRIIVAALAVGVLGLVSLALPLEPVRASTTPEWARPFQDAFEPGCAVPFATLAVHHPVDTDCAITGTGSAGSQAQNQRKNNFCATGQPVDVTNTSFRKLQKAADDDIQFDTWGNAPADRSDFEQEDLVTTSEGHTLHEGSLVRYVGFIMHGKHSNVSNGETVNCKLTGKEANDIHLYLARVKTEPDDCKSVTAEIIPHSRPTSWNQLGSLFTDKHKHAATRIKEANLARPLRFTGQLMFDTAHEPCRSGHAATPGRFSAWEIHPVYAIDVCTNTSWTACPVDDESVWTPLNQWK